ncbi:peptidylprolyl isomerase [Shewanella surugensis]|uniref:peptidylprolyl isomerase n=1 Tax=Shewanella surugensis TaxID=212020 RepID=A0ABT0LBR5_9GAMM|nr:peptidylprolyl isomerase [Shewanella surugensis]MCL1125090.1 peptidyl-prolyl cis-trans isomerase [Shewanella surugensis]
MQATDRAGSSAKHTGCHGAEVKAETLPDISNIQVNGVLIDEASVLAEMQYHNASSQSAAMVEAVRSLIIHELLLQQLKKTSIKEDIEALNSTEESAYFDRLIEQEVYTPQANEQECQHFFDNNRKKFSTSPLLEVRHILLAASPEDIKLRAELKVLAENMIESLKQDIHGFEALVEMHSACPSKKHKGQLGQVSKGQTVAEFEKYLLVAEEGLIPFVIESRYGFHVVVIDRRVEGVELPFEYVKDRILGYLNEKVQRKATAQYIQTLIQAADIKGLDFDMDTSPLLQ